MIKPEIVMEALPLLEEAIELLEEHLESAECICALDTGSCPCCETERFLEKVKDTGA